jgi:hypothetical protein
VESERQAARDEEHPRQETAAVLPRVCCRRLPPAARESCVGWLQRSRPCCSRVEGAFDTYAARELCASASLRGATCLHDTAWPPLPQDSACHRTTPHTSQDVQDKALRERGQRQRARISAARQCARDTTRCAPCVRQRW